MPTPSDLDYRRGRLVACGVAALAVLALALLVVASARGAPADSRPPAATATAASSALHLRAHLTPDALAAWLAASEPRPAPDILDATEIDNHDPAAVVVRAVAVDAIVSAEWESHGETEIATDGTAQAVIEARKYVLKEKP